MDPDIVDADREASVTFYRLQPMYYDGTQFTVSLMAWLHDMEALFEIGHIEAHLRVTLASRLLIGNALLWWITTGERNLPSRTWADFRELMIMHFAQVADQEGDVPYRDPEIYNDMMRTRYFTLAALWRAYPHESMGHYCRRFLDAMLPHIPQDLEGQESRAVRLIRDGLPYAIRRHVHAPVPGTTLAHMIESIMDAEVVSHYWEADAYIDVPEQAPVDDAGMGEYIHENGPVFPQDPIPAEPVQAIPHEEEDQVVPVWGEDDHVQDHPGWLGPDDQADVPVEDPPVEEIAEADDDHEDEEPEPEPEFEEGLEEDEIVWGPEIQFEEEDPEEIPMGDDEWDAFSDVTAADGE